MTQDLSPRRPEREAAASTLRSGLIGIALVALATLGLAAAALLITAVVWIVVG